MAGMEDCAGEPPELQQDQTDITSTQDYKSQIEDATFKSDKTSIDINKLNDNCIFNSVREFYLQN